MVRSLFLIAILFFALGWRVPGPVPDVMAEDRMQTAIEVLARTATGHTLLDRAAANWGVRRSDLKKKFRWGNVSRTHAVLTRRLDSKTGKEIREREITIYIRRDGSLEELVLDMAHEMVHAIARPAWDPYDPALTAGRYISAAIEGEGGEVDAMVTECSVHRELETRIPLSKRCSRYLSSNGVPDRARIRKDFYQVGEYSADLSQRLGRDRDRLPLLSSSPPELLSSTGRAPYPVALFEEYEELMRVACENSRKRIEVISSQSLRTPASISHPVRETTEQFIKSRCVSGT
ncbi:MAG: hypothetical protein A2X94_07135 [Bdellovibrionales bacterium GWB1_55_8]|nr:MAG: hypothetical protein A2X94_07135 [Bdellovibrionales bacterium GWB1_55_8]